MAIATLELTDKDHPSNEGEVVDYYGKMEVKPYEDGVEITVQEVGPYDTDQRAFVVLTGDQVQTLKEFLA